MDLQYFMTELTNFFTLKRKGFKNKSLCDPRKLSSCIVKKSQDLSTIL